MVNNKNKALILASTFFSVNKARNLTTLLWVMTFAVGLIGSLNEIVTGVVVALLQLIFVLAYGFSYRCYPAYQQMRASPWFYRIFCLWVIVLTLSYVQIFFAQHEQQGFYQIASSYRHVTWLIHVFFVLSVASFLQQLDKPQAVPLEIINSSALLLIFYVYQLLTEPVLSSDVWFMGPPFAFHIRLVGYLFVAAFVVALAGFVCGRQWWQRALFWGLLIAFGSALVWLGGRASVLAALVVMALMAIYIVIYMRNQLWLLLGLLLVLPAAYYLAMAFVVFEWNGFAAVAEANIAVASSDDVDLNSLTTGRVLIWQETLAALWQSPMLGWGPNGYLFIPDHRMGFGIHPHNVFVQFLIEWGLLGASLTALLLIWLLGRLLRTLGLMLQAGKLAPVSAALVLLALSINGLADGTYYHAQSLYYLSLCFAVYPFFVRSKIQD